MICSGVYGRKNVYDDAGVTLVTGYDYMMRSSTATLNDVNDDSGRFHQNMTDPGADHDRDLDPCRAVEVSGCEQAGTGSLGSIGAGSLGSSALGEGSLGSDETEEGSGSLGSLGSTGDCDCGQPGESGWSSQAPTVA